MAILPQLASGGDTRKRGIISKVSVIIWIAFSLGSVRTRSILQQQGIFPFTSSKYNSSDKRTRKTCVHCSFARLVS